MPVINSETQSHVTVPIAPISPHPTVNHATQKVVQCRFRSCRLFRWCRDPSTASRKSIVFNLPPSTKLGQLTENPYSSSTLSIPSQSPVESVIFFDWDDTLCPSTWIKLNRPKLDYFKPCPDDPRYTIPLHELAIAVCSLLRIAADHGRIVIVTNAQLGWVKTSCANFLPDVADTISELDIQVIYSRGQGNPADVSVPTKWKHDAFQAALSDLGTPVDSIVSVGDQVYERDAAHRLCKRQGSRSKTVKLIEDPSISDLTDQLNYLKDAFGKIASMGEDIDAEFSLS